MQVCRKQQKILLSARPFFLPRNSMVSTHDPFSLFQTLEITQEPSHISRKQYQIYREPDFLIIPVYPDCRSPWHADLWWQVSRFVEDGAIFNGLFLFVPNWKTSFRPQQT